MKEEIRVRFAPSPTGFLHIGGVRTALFNWLFARHHGGKFILRIEDTDHDRSTQESIDEILESMKWLGLDWDEGPYRQTERQELYTEKVKDLLSQGKAYRCYCTPEELDQRRKDAQEKGLKPKYNGLCRDRGDQPEGIPFVIRFKIPQTGVVEVEDILRGKVQFDNQELDDFIIQRTDGTPTYNFVVVVDDVDMGITHVIRGDDHLSNTPRQAHLCDGLGASRPQFGHISMILGTDKARLSKRHGATSALAYREMGYLPDALINYLARLGWSHGDQEIFTREEMIKHFALETVTTSAAIFNPEKLLWLNHQYIQSAPPSSLVAVLEPILVKEGILKSDHGLNADELERPISHLNKRSETLVEMALKSAFYFKEDVEFDEKVRNKFLTVEIKPHLEELMQQLEKLNDFSSENVEAVFKEMTEKAEMKLGKLAQPVRAALTGKKESPGIYDVVILLGRERTLNRLKNSIAWIDNIKSA
jgi:glutamyl-tRNA synthetase